MGRDASNQPGEPVRLQRVQPKPERIGERRPDGQGVQLEARAVVRVQRGAKPAGLAPERDGHLLRERELVGRDDQGALLEGDMKAPKVPGRQEDSTERSPRARRYRTSWRSNPSR